MKKAVAIILLISLFCSLFAGGALFASADSVENALAAAKPELYGLYTAQSAALLRDRYDRAVVRGGADNAAALLEALDALSPLESYKREALLGFDGIDEGELSRMKSIRGSASASGGFVTLSGEGTLRYSNAAGGGITGPSPFGIATPASDGFVIKINSASSAALDLEIGRRGSASDCVFTISDVAISEGEKYYLFPFSRFGDLPLDGTLNYISLTFTGTPDVTFGDLHAAASAAGTAEERVYAETPMTSQSFVAGNYYKILQRGTTLALTMLDDKSMDGRLVFTENAEDDAQLWQISRDPAIVSRFRFVNKKY